MNQEPTNITLRTATLDDLELLEYWNKQPHVKAGVPVDEWDWEAELRIASKWEEKIIAELNGRPLGFLQIIDAAREETRCWGDVEEGNKAVDIWIGKADDLGKGYGTEMMHLGVG